MIGRTICIKTGSGSIVLEEGKGSEEEVDEWPDDVGMVDSKLAVILFALIDVDADVTNEVADKLMEVFKAESLAGAAAAAEATLRAAWIILCFLVISLPSRKASYSLFIH